MSVISLLGLFAAIAVLILLIYKGMHSLMVAVISCLILIFTSGLDVWTTYVGGPNGSFTASMMGFMQNFILMFAIGAVLGEFLSKSGFAFSIAMKLSDLFGTKHAVLIVVVSTMILAYGGVSMFVIVFAVYPIAAVVFKRANITKNLLPGCICLGAGTFVMTALPGSPTTINVVATQYLGTTIWAAPVLGTILAVLMFVLGTLYLLREEKKYREKGEGFEAGENEYIQDITEETRNNAPNFVLSVLPVIIIFAFNVIGTKLGLNATYAVCLGMAASIVYIWLVAHKRIESVFACLNKGCTNSIGAIINTSAIIGFGGVVKMTPAFGAITNFALNLPFAPIISAVLATGILAGVTTSSTGGLTLFLEMLGAEFLAKGINPEVMHRLCAIASGTLDSLPHSGPNLTLCMVIGVTMKNAYKHMGMITCVLPTIAVIVGVILAAVGVC